MPQLLRLTGYKSSDQVVDVFDSYLVDVAYINKVCEDAILVEADASEWPVDQKDYEWLCSIIAETLAKHGIANISIEGVEENQFSHHDFQVQCGSKCKSDDATSYDWRTLARLMSMGWQAGDPDAQAIGRKIAIWPAILASIWLGLTTFGWPKLAWGVLILGLVIISAVLLPRRLSGALNDNREPDNLLTDQTKVGLTPRQQARSKEDT